MDGFSKSSRWRNIPVFYLGEKLGRKLNCGKWDIEKWNTVSSFAFCLAACLHLHDKKKKKKKCFWGRILCGQELSENYGQRAADDLIQLDVWVCKYVKKNIDQNLLQQFKCQWHSYIASRVSRTLLSSPIKGSIPRYLRKDHELKVCHARIVAQSLCFRLFPGHWKFQIFTRCFRIQFHYLATQPRITAETERNWRSNSQKRKFFPICKIAGCFVLFKRKSSESWSNVKKHHTRAVHIRMNVCQSNELLQRGTGS